MTGDEPQGTMGRVQTGGCPLPAFLYAPIFMERETSGYGAAFDEYFIVWIENPIIFGGFFVV